MRNSKTEFYYAGSGAVLVLVPVPVLIPVPVPVPVLVRSVRQSYLERRQVPEADTDSEKKS